MSNRERFIVYALLATLCMFNIITFFGRAQNAAYAQPAEALQKLGPAQSLTLAQSDSPDKNIELRNRNQHLSWGEQPYKAAYSVALLHVGKPLYKLMMSETYMQPRQELQDQMTAEAKQRDADLRALYDQLQQMDPKDPAAGETQKKFIDMRDDFQQWYQQAQARAAKLEADSLMKAYDEIVAAVDVVAERRGIDMVLRFLPQELDEDTVIDTPDAAQAVIRGRTAVKYPEALDITNAVMEELSLDVE